MSDNLHSTGGRIFPANDRRLPDPDLAAAIAAGLGDRRGSPRVIVQEPCFVQFGRHAHDAVLRDVSAGGAMLRGVPGLIAGDLVHLTVPRLGGRRFAARVRAVTLLGAHLALADEAEAEAWEAALSPILHPLLAPGFA